MNNPRVIGIVAEYNPFHLGHSYQIKKAKEILGDAPVIAVMSGNFTQRGEIACLDKWQRTELALKGGVDLVLELPTIYALRSSETFGGRAVELLAGTGIVSHLVFGCETTKPEILAEAAKENITKEKLTPYLKKGLTYGAAVNAYLTTLYPTAKEMLKEPNNILALSYYQALNKLSMIEKETDTNYTNTNNSEDYPSQGKVKVPEALPIQRKGAGYKADLEENLLPSAQGIRHVIDKTGDAISLAQAFPSAVFTTLCHMLEEEPIALDYGELYTLLRFALYKTTPELLARTIDASEGLENKMLSAIKEESLEAFLGAVKSKRYPLTRIQRLIYQLLISTEKVPFAETKNLPPSYLRVLGFTSRGQKLLKEMKSTSTLPLLTKLHKNELEGQPEAFAQSLRADIAATNLYDLIKHTGAYNRDFTTSPVRVQR